MMDRFAKEREEDAQLHLLQIYRQELAELRAFMLYSRNQRKIPLESLDVMERGLSRIIEGLESLRRDTSLDYSIEKAQASVRKAKKMLFVASDILEQSLEKPRSSRSSKALYESYEGFADLLLEAIKIFDIPLSMNLKDVVTQNKNREEVHEEEVGGKVVSIFRQPGSLNQEESEKEKKQVPAEADTSFDSNFSLFAVARTILEENDKAYIGKTYKVQIRISGNISENFGSESLDLPVDLVNATIAFDILLHVSENVEIAGEWGKHLDYMPSNREPQPVEFGFRVTASGSRFIVVDFYRELCWVKTIKLEFNAIEEP